VESVGHVVHSDPFGARNVDTLFSCTGGLGVVSIKSRPGHVMLKLCFCIKWNLWVTQCIPACPGCKMSMYRFSCSIRPGAISIKSALAHIMQNLCFYILWDLRVM
jgi:hypothetical protein